MKRLLLSMLCVATSLALSAQTTILDFETTETSTTFQYFGSTLEGSLNSVIANPDPSGVNTSANVAEFKKPAGAQTWAGAFANPITMPFMVADGNDICMKVWFPAAGNVALKLEGGGASPDWITTQEVTEVNTWTEICFKTTDNSIEAPSMPAAGGTYTQLVLFFDFGTSPTAEIVYYFDDVVVEAAMAEPVDVSFAVDMNAYSENFTNVYVYGSFNEWSSNANPMTDDNGDGIYTTTVTGIEGGAIEYRFQLDEGMVGENFSGYYPCTVTDPTGQFTNRSVAAFENIALDTVCWESCFACGEGVKITINLGEAGINVSEEGLYIAGGGNFGNPGEFKLTDPDGDGIHSAVFEKKSGFESFYTFTNGACGNFSCKEDIVGQDCADPNNFNDRFMGPITQDTVIATCFGICTTEATDCLGGSIDVGFKVDMSTYSGTFTKVYVYGTFNNWSTDANPMIDDDGDGIYITTVKGVTPGAIEYKFHVDEGTVIEDFSGVYYTCTITDPDGQFTNRAVTLFESTDLEVVCWESCYACGDAVKITINLGDAGIDVSDDGLFIAGGGNFGAPGEFKLIDDDGDGVYTGVFEKKSGFESFYTFTNGACGDFNCKENIAGQSCANPDNFDDRFMGPITEDTTISTCFGVCSDDATDCSVGVEVDFQVDMNNYAEAFTTVYVSGTINNWSGTDNPMTDSDGDGIWTTTITLNPGTYKYKFTLDNWTVQEAFTQGDPCTVSDDTGQFVDRVLEVSEDAVVCYQWNTCTSCIISARELQVDHSIFRLRPNITQGTTQLIFTKKLNEIKTVRLFNATGVLIAQYQLGREAYQQQIDLSSLASGLYVVTVQAGHKLASKKLIRQ